MLTFSVKSTTDTEKRGTAEYDISMEEMEQVMDKHCDRIMLPTLMTKCTLHFPDGKVVEYAFNEKDNCIYKRTGKILK